MDREALIRAIREYPAEDDPRHRYADWLDEFGDCDRDRATAEFIRVSCDFRTHTVLMPATAYEWLRGSTEGIANWRRLIPAAIAIPEKDPKYPLRPAVDGYYREGRKFPCAITLQTRPNYYRRYSVVFDFWRGFLHKFLNWSAAIQSRLKPLLFIDQPLFTC